MQPFSQIRGTDEACHNHLYATLTQVRLQFALAQTSVGARPQAFTNSNLLSCSR